MSHAPTESGAHAPKAAALIAAYIRKQIVMGELVEGDSLPSEAVLLDQLSVSRPTLRQAFRILEAEHLITVQRGSRGGTTVLSPSIKLASRYLCDLLRYRGATLGDVVKAQLMIEPAAVAQLARRRDDQAIADLRDSVAEEKAAATAREQNRTAEQFHIRLVELAGNSTLAQYCKILHHLINAHVQRYESINRPNDTGLRHSPVDAHERLIELIAAGAAYAASNHWHLHLEDVRDRLAERLDVNSGLESPQS